jgi:hypothetical protein
MSKTARRCRARRAGPRNTTASGDPAMAFESSVGSPGALWRPGPFGSLVLPRNGGRTGSAYQSTIPKNGYRFSEKIMLKRESAR